APERLSGPVALDLTYAEFERGRAEANATLDLRATTLAIPEAGWKKAADQPGTAKLVFELDNEKFSKNPQVEIKAAGLDGRFAIVLGGDRHHIDHIDIRRLLVGNNELSGSVGRRVEGGWR